jgi:quercetin dioxygenase-like cupin family protein
VLCTAQALTDDNTGGAAAGATWKLEVSDRQLDANVVRLAPGRAIQMHRGPDLDVLVLVVAGTGMLVSRAGAVPLLPGHLVWLPRRSDRSFIAGSDGISYLTVHQRRPLLRVSHTSR